MYLCMILCWYFIYLYTLYVLNTDFPVLSLVLKYTQEHKYPWPFGNLVPYYLSHGGTTLHQPDASGLEPASHFSALDLNKSRTAALHMRQTLERAAGVTTVTFTQLCPTYSSQVSRPVHKGWVMSQKTVTTLMTCSFFPPIWQIIWVSPSTHWTDAVLSLLRAPWTRISFVRTSISAPCGIVYVVTGRDEH